MNTDDKVSSKWIGAIAAIWIIALIAALPTYDKNPIYLLPYFPLGLNIALRVQNPSTPFMVIGWLYYFVVTGILLLARGKVVRSVVLVILLTSLIVNIGGCRSVLNMRL